VIPGKSSPEPLFNIPTIPNLGKANRCHLGIAEACPADRALPSSALGRYTAVESIGPCDRCRMLFLLFVRKSVDLTRLFVQLST
jgi:hypothetical protein